MPTLEEALEERSRQQAAEKAQAEKQQTTEQQRITGALLSHYENLLNNEDFQWWLNEKLKPLVKVEHDAALDTKRTAAERSDSAHRHAALNEITEGFFAEHRRLKSKLEELYKTS